MINIKSTMCNDIEFESWICFPNTLKYSEFCKHCEFKCEHGLSVIKRYKEMIIND